MRPEPVRLDVGAEPGFDGLAEALALAGYERVERAEERGQFAVRGGLVDVFPTTGREPLRIELFGDEIEQVRAFSPFTQRALHPVDERRRLPGGRAARRPGRADARGRRGRAARSSVPTDLVPRARPPARLRLAARRGAARLGGGGARGGRRSQGATELDPFPQAQPFSFEAQRPAIAARGLAEAENELAGFVRGGNRVVVAFPHAGEALRTENLLKRADARVARARRGPAGAAGAPLRRRARAARLRLARARPRPARPTRRSSASGRRAPTARLGRALASFADLRTGDFVVHEDHGVGKLLGFETKEVAGVTRDYLFLAFRGEDRLYVPHEQLGKVSKYIGADAQRARALEARRQGVAEPEGAGPRVASASSRPS